MKLLYADNWLIDAVVAANLPKEKLLDLPVLLDTVSSSDVAFYLELNSNLEGFLPAALVRSFSPVEFKIKGWVSEKKVQEIADIQEASRLKGPPATPVDTKNRDLVITTDILNADTLLAHYVEHPEATINSSLQKAKMDSEFTNRVIRQMLTDLTFDAVATLPIMGWYLRSRQEVLNPIVIK